MRTQIPGLQVPATPNYRPGIRQALDAVVLQGVRLLTGWLGILFIIFAPFDWLYTMPAAAGHAASALDLAIGVVMLAVFLFVRSGRVRAIHANAAAAVMAGFALPYVLLTIWLTGLPVQSAGVALWQIGIALIFLSWPWIIGMLAASNVIWIAEVLLGLHGGHLRPSDDWAQYGYILATSTIIGLVAHGVRLRTYTHLEGLRLEEHARRIELEQAQAVAREVEAMRRLGEIKTQFINTAAHELATPLTPVLLEFRVLRNDYIGAATVEQARSWGILERNLLRLQSLLQDVLDSARLQTDRLPMTDARFDLGKIVYEAVADHEGQARSRELLLASDVPRSLHVVGDPKRLQQVVANLIANAIKFTPAGGNVTVTAGIDHGVALVEIADTGLGIAPQEMPRLFAPFVQVHDTVAHQLGGTGLGLYICKGIVEHYGGQIGCRSDGSGKGATFWFTMPLVPGV